jgi:hypothetical protein
MCPFVDRQISVLRKKMVFSEVVAQHPSLFNSNASIYPPQDGHRDRLTIIKLSLSTTGWPAEGGVAQWLSTWACLVHGEDGAPALTPSFVKGFQ